MHVLVAADIFRDLQLQRIAAAVEGRGTWERVSQTAPAAEHASALSRSDVVVGWPPAAWLASSPVRFFQLLSAGYDAYVDAGLDVKPGFTLCNARGALSIAVAEHCIALMLALVRRLPLHVRDMAARRWERAAYDEVFGATACIVGLGDIGTDPVTMVEKFPDDLRSDEPGSSGHNHRPLRHGHRPNLTRSRSRSACLLLTAY